MKNMTRRIGILTTALLLTAPTFALAQGQDHGQHGGMAMPAKPAEAMKGHDMGGMQAHEMGVLLGEKKVEGYTLIYRLLDKAERDVMMKGMEGMDMHGMSKSADITNHLMIYLKGADGQYASGKVGFSVTGPDGKEAKTLTMGMHGGYGADIAFKEKGTYKIKTKAVIGDKTLTDEFSHEVK